MESHEFLDSAFAMIKDYVLDSQGKVNQHIEPSSRSKTTDTLLPLEGFSQEMLLEDVSSYLQNEGTGIYEGGFLLSTLSSIDG